MKFLRLRSHAPLLFVVGSWVVPTAEGAGGNHAGSDPAPRGGSITDTSVSWPGWREVINVLTLRDYNTRVVVLGVSCLGLACGVVGSFMLLRKRALLGDALSHATLPGIGIAFLVMTQFGGSGKWLPGLLLGATVSGVMGMACVLLIVHLTRVKEDAALGIVLSVFFGVGAAILGIIQNLGTGSAAGLESFIYGKTASMVAQDAELIAIAAGVVTLVCAALFRELALLCFDSTFSSSLGRPVILLDVVMMALVVGVTVIGLQAVGLMLMVALLIIPPAAARFWTQDLSTMVVMSAAIGAVSGFLGAGLSAVVPRLPAGAVIVLVGGVLFVISLVFGPARGVLSRGLARWRLDRKIARQHLLRAMHEWFEALEGAEGVDSLVPGVPLNDLLRIRSWTVRQLRSTLRSAERDGLVVRNASAGNPLGFVTLTPDGATAARRMVRNHRLWEHYLITHADIAPSHVDRDADEVEHVLDAGLVHALEAQLAGMHPELAVPASPHRMDSPQRVEEVKRS